jgi:hypothetical protein
MTILETKTAPAEGQSRPPSQNDSTTHTENDHVEEKQHEHDQNRKDGDAEANYPSAIGLTLIAVGLCLSAFLVSLVRNHFSISRLLRSQVPKNTS